MAKIEMMCPFSGELCQECPLYRGRHYYLCFCEKYRGRLDRPADAGGSGTPSASGFLSAKKFEIPLVKSRSAIDPFAIIIKERKEGGLN